MDRPCGVLCNSYAKDMAIVSTRLQWGLLVGGLILLFCSPLFINLQLLSIINLMAITLIAIQGLNILTGYTGQISLGQAAFMAVGGYTSSILATRFGLSFWVTLPCGALSAGLVGVLFGLPSLRVKGFYLAMSTLAAQFIIYWVLMHTPQLGAGPDAVQVSAPELGGLKLTSQQNMFYVIMPLAVLATFLTKNLVRTRVGRAFIATRDNDLAAEVMGINVFSYKLLAFFICSLFAGAAGALYGAWARALRPDYFTLMQSIMYLGMLVVGGIGSTAGAVFGTIFMVGLDQLVTALAPALISIAPQLGLGVTASISKIVFGLVMVLFLRFEPRGLAHRWELFKASYRLWPFAY